MSLKIKSHEIILHVWRPRSEISDIGEDSSIIELLGYTSFTCSINPKQENLSERLLNTNQNYTNYPWILSAPRDYVSRI